MNKIDFATEKDRAQILALYNEQIGREFCAWDEDYPGNETIDYDLSRNALIVMRKEDMIIAAISIEEDEEVDGLECWTASRQPSGDLVRLAVSPKEQNRGIARIMLQYAMDVLKERGK